MKHAQRLLAPLRPRSKANEPWQKRHHQAELCPQGFERPIYNMIAAWLEYADRHQKLYGSGIGQDGVLGHEWAKIGLGLRGLLNGETGRLDCGTLDGVILGALKAEGLDE